MNKPHPDFQFAETLRLLGWRILIGCVVFGWCDRSLDWYRHWQSIGPEIVIVQFFTVLPLTCIVVSLRPQKHV